MIILGDILSGIFTATEVAAVAGFYAFVVEICLFAACTIAKISLERLSRAILPFMAFEVAVLMIVSFLPPIVLFVPRLFGYA